MAEVKVLVEGVVGENTPTVCLILDGDIKMVSDPGCMEDKQLLLQNLQIAGLKPEDINFVFLTHSHIDHYSNIGLFPNAKLLEFFGVWEKNRCDDWNENFSDNIKIIKTPGHDRTSLTMLVKTENGKVAICGDVFWKENYPEHDQYADDENLLIESRQKVLEMADYVVPGHGPMFRVKK
jgi:glyoxylase-like metal-dependent hydrolase (beta-lactamase superfamily II)